MKTLEGILNAFSANVINEDKGGKSIKIYFRFRDEAATAIRSYYLSLLPEKKDTTGLEFELLMEADAINETIDEMKKRIGG